MRSQNVWGETRAQMELQSIEVRRGGIETFPRGSLMQNSLASPISTALSVEPETRSSAEVANLQHIRTICSSVGKKKKKEKATSKQPCGAAVFGGGEGEGPPPVARARWHCLRAQRITGLMGVFFPWALAPRRVARRCQLIACDTRARTRKHGTTQSQASPCFVSGDFFYFFPPPHLSTIKVAITSIINYGLMAGEELDWNKKKGGWGDGKKESRLTGARKEILFLAAGDSFIHHWR